MDGQLKAGIAGAGVFGGYHAQKYSAIAGVDLVGVYDTDNRRADAFAQTHGIKAFGADRLDEFLAGIDILSLTTPARFHGELILKALEAGLSVYCEKPLTLTEATSRQAVDLAVKHKAVLACGHQERCVFESIGLLGIEEKPKFFRAVRCGTPSPRNLDVSVGFDLMIHDLDLGIILTGDSGQIDSVKGIRRENAGTEIHGADEIEAVIRFGACKAEFLASRIAEARRREMVIDYESGSLFIDFLNRRFENTTAYDLNPDFAETALSKDSLGASIKRFVDCVRKDIDHPLCAGAEAMRAVSLAERIDARLMG